MSITLELTPQEEELVRNAARESGQPMDLFLKERAFRGLAEASFPQESSSAESTWSRLKRAGEAAGRDAIARAHSLGLGVVYSQEGAVVEELPDGAVRVLHPAE